MREYGQIQCSFWQRASEEQWSGDATLLGAYLLTGPHSNGIGCYRLPDGYVCDDLGWAPERVRKGFQELFDKGFCKRYGMVVLVPKFLRWNTISNGNVAKARSQEFEAIPNDEAKVAAALVLLEFGRHWENAFIKRLETLSKGYAKQNPTQPNPTQEESVGADAPPPADEKKKAKPVPKAALGADALVAMGVDATHARDWLAVRKLKRAALTQTALDDLISEARKASISVAEAVRICALKSWQGFNAGWDWQQYASPGALRGSAKAKDSGFSLEDALQAQGAVQ